MLAVIFSVLAIAFVFEIDDTLMEAREGGKGGTRARAHGGRGGVGDRERAREGGRDRERRQHAYALAKAWKYAHVCAHASADASHVRCAHGDPHK